jgi:hypothetical protein
MSKTWKIEDVSDRAIDAKYTYYLPSKKALKLLAPGDAVKIVFLCDVENDKGWNAERMWVQITKRGLFGFEGFLDNDPYYIPDIKAGDTVRFKSKHIIQISIDDPVPNSIDKYLPRCFVSDSVLNGEKKVTRLFREEPEEDQENYSGWTLFSTDDEKEYLNKSDNWHYVSLGAVLNRGDQFKELLESPYDTEYVWDESNRNYNKI